jgi:hypothetical protein
MTEPADDKPFGLQVPLVWVGLDDVEILYANQFIGQLDDRCEAVLSIGQVMPPPVLGTPEEQREQAKNIPFVQVRTIGRVSLTRARIEELMNVLQQTLDNQTACRTIREGLDS